MTQQLITRFPGRKGARYCAMQPEPYTPILLEPFVGSGTQSLMAAAAHAAEHLYVADADPAVYALWQAVADPAMHQQVYRQVALYQHWLQAALNSRNDTAVDEWWENLKDLYIGSDTHPADRAAVGLVVRTATFGGYVRSGSLSDSLNIRFVAGQLAHVLRWEYRFPTLPFWAQVHLFDEWKSACRAALKTGEEITAILDPPYWVPGNDGQPRMTPAYYQHLPYAEATYQLAVKPLVALLQAEQVRKVSLCNYYSERLAIAATAAAQRYGWEVEELDYGVLDQSHKGCATRTTRRDTVWIFRRKA